MLVAIANKHFDGLTPYRAARALHQAITAYETRVWPRVRDNVRNPHRKDTLQAAVWNLLELDARVPGPDWLARRIGAKWGF
jgi:hypothetical protein